ncbi:MAG: Na(+)/H(+) antiporter subunit B [Gammaproteobacteria bacterium]|jgi:multicomponent Na+:H+ antiporter subunit B|nr:Na(+)/H(+) antiporter subunit B [Gammaproteobacteria bacterium]
MENLINDVLLGLLMITGFAIVRMKSLLGVTMLTSIYSLLSASLFVVLDAVDVALTEAAIGAGIATVLMVATVALTTDEEKVPRHTPLLPLLVVMATGAALIYGTLDMPHHGDPLAPAHRYVADSYLHDSPVEIGVPNVVTSVLASYRGYDTLGEVTVIFTAAAGVLALLGYRTRGRNIEAAGIRKQVVLRVIAKLFFPLILLFALYVQFHGDYGPGGGFQAGVIFATGFILYALAFGLGTAQRLIPSQLLRILAAAGVLIYAAVGLESMLLGGKFLEYRVLADDPIAGQHLGILLIELGVGITVASVMLIIYYGFVSRRH